MSAISNQAITKVDFDDLATLVNSKLGTAFVFPPFSDKIASPADIKITPTYAPAGGFATGDKVTLRLYAYKTIDGVKTYTSVPLIKAFYSDGSKGPFSLQWDWKVDTSVNAPEGYIVSIPIGSVADGWSFQWKDIGNVLTLTETGAFSDPSWKVDVSLDANATGPGIANMPCAHGVWLKQFNLIREKVNFQTDIGCVNTGDVTGLSNIGGDGKAGSGSITTLGISALISGPWCVGVSGGVGANTLSAWVARTSIYVQGGTTGFSPAYTQCYREVKFYFRAVDALTGVNITAQNQLLNFTIGSNIGDITSFHYHLKVVSCSTGHLHIQDTVGGTVRADLDVVAGTVYDLSFDAAGIPDPTVSHPLNVDFVFTTPAATVNVADGGLELNGDVRSCAVPDSYCQVEFNNPIANSSGGLASVQLCTTCLQLTLTEQNNTPGIWVANTLPSSGIMTYLDVDLPQYANDTDLSTRRAPLDPDLVYTPSVPNRGALWPVFRDTDFTPDLIGGQPVNGSKAWQALGTKSITPINNTNTIPPYEPGEVLFNYSTFVRADATKLLFFTSNANCTLLAKAGDFPTVADHDFAVAGGEWGSVPSGFAKDAFWFYSIQNNSSTAVSSDTTAIVVIGDAPNGTFFQTQPDDSGAIVAMTEKYSYHFPSFRGGTDPLLNPIPLFGYSIFALNIERQPAPNDSGVFIPDTDGEDLVVEIGYMKGFGWDTAGAFQVLQTITIPAGTSGKILPGFLPVLSGTFLAYRCTEQVNIAASVNFQPMMHSLFNPVTTKLGGADYIKGFFNGDAWYEFPRSHVYFPTSIKLPVLLQFSAVAVNDLENLIALLP